MGKSSRSSDRQPAGKSPPHHLPRDPKALRQAHAAVHRFVEEFDAEVEDALNAARARRLAAIKRIEQTVRYLHSRYVLTDQAAGTCPNKPSGLSIEPDFSLALKALEATPLAGCLSELHDAIAALERYDGVPFNRKPLVLRNAGGKTETGKKDKSGSTATGPEETSLAALARAGQGLIGLFRGLVERLAASCTTRAARRKTQKGGPSGLLTPPQVAKQLGVSADKILGWIRKGELHATNVATGGGGRPRYRISDEELAEFQRTRQNVKPPPKPSRRRKKDPNVIEFFK